MTVCKTKEQKTEPVTNKEYHSAVRGDSWKMKLVSTIDLCKSKARSRFGWGDGTNHSKQEADGRTDPTGDGNQEDTRTGWEEERKEVFTYSNKTSRDRHQLSDSDIGFDSDFAHDLLQLGKNLESLGEEPYEEPIQDSTNTPHHIDKKRQRELREKGMSQSM